MKTLLAVLALAQISGYVYTPGGGVAAGKIVRVGDKSVTTDKDGAFTIDGLQEGVVELEVESTRVFALTGDIVTITASKLDKGPPPWPAPHGGDGTITGRVLLDGKPLANAPVILQGFSEGKAERFRVVSNAKGAFVAKNLPPLRYAVGPDERLFPRLRWPHSQRSYAEGQEPYVVDLSKTREASMDVELLSSHMIRGRVVDAEGKPVARARVMLAIANRSSFDFAFNDDAAYTLPDGRFSFPAPEWTDKEQVQVSVTPALQSTTRSKPFTLGDNREIHIILPKVETVRVRVLDPAGKPIPDARVAYASSVDTSTFDSLAILLEEPFESRMLRTNADGEVVLRLSADTYDFIAKAEGFQTESLPLQAISKPATVDLTLENAATLRGRVHRGERGVANAAINVLGERARGRHVMTHTDADGKFELTGLAPGPFRIGVIKQEEMIDRKLEVEAPGEIDIALPPTGTLRGRVIDAATGEPVTEFAYLVTPVQADPNARDLNGMQRSASNPDGTFTLEVPAGNYRVSAGAQGFTLFDPADVHVVENETTNVDLSLGRGAMVSGRITDESGVPLRGAAVMIENPEHERSMRAQRAPHVGSPRAETNADGTFTITGVEPGPADVTVRQTGFLLYRKTIEIEGTISLEIRLSRGLTIQGTVTKGGKPLGGVQIGATTTAVGGEHQPTISEVDGRFTLTGLIHARYTITAYHEEEQAELRDVDPTRQKEIALSLDAKPRGVVYGTVTGIPPALGDKYVRRMVAVTANEQTAEAWIDDEGGYRIENAPVGEVMILAYVESASHVARSSSPKRIDVVGGEPLRVDLELGGTVRVSGRVTMDGKPVAGAQVGFVSENGISQTQTREDGMYDLMLPATGLHQIHTRAEKLSDREFRTSRDIRGGETIDIELREQVVEGMIVDAGTRQPIAGAMVTIVPQAGTAAWIAIENAQTDANGRFRIVSTSLGPHRLIASAPGYAHRVQPLGSTTTQHVFELSPAPDLAVRVIDARTGAVLDAQVVVGDEAGFIPMWPRRTSDGTTHLFSLAPGRYQVTVFLRDYVKKVVEVTAPGAMDVMME